MYKGSLKGVNIDSAGIGYYMAQHPKDPTIATDERPSSLPSGRARSPKQGRAPVLVVQSTGWRRWLHEARIEFLRTPMAKSGSVSV
jgi:hypothetical protein